ncbi:MAG: ABC transporter permease [Acidaminococcaceae bacterium]
MLKIKVEKSLAPSSISRIVVPIVAAFCALLFCAVFFALTNRNPLDVYTAMFMGALGSEYGISETIVKTIPLALCALGIAVAFRMQLWNIGAEGQFYMGACAATWVPLTFPQWPFALMLPAMIVMSVLGGGLWGLIAGWFKTKWLVNEIITTLMMNYIAILWVNYLVYGAWKDPQGLNFPLTAAFPAAAMLPTFGALRVHYGIFFVLILVGVFLVVFKDSRWGYETLVIGSNPTAARYAGINIRRNVLLAMFISGAVSGFAGMVEVSGIVGKLQPGISPGYGYTAIIVAWLARLHPVAIVIVAFLFAIISVGGFMVQTLGIPSAAATMLQGAILFFVVGADILTQYEIKLVGKGGGADE